MSQHQRIVEGERSQHPGGILGWWRRGRRRTFEVSEDWKPVEPGHDLTWPDSVDLPSDGSGSDG